MAWAMPWAKASAAAVQSMRAASSGQAARRFSAQAANSASVRAVSRARVLAALDETAAELGATPAQVALAWQMARPGITAPIASATGVVQLQELLGAARLRLSPAQGARLDGASAGL
jgi:aryl-alcohol dehydrogenase-like predicted oxidoreductase